MTSQTLFAENERGDVRAKRRKTIVYCANKCQNLSKKHPRTLLNDTSGTMCSGLFGKMTTSNYLDNGINDIHQCVYVVDQSAISKLD